MRDGNDDELVIYTVYDHPSDFPDHYVVRPFVSDKNGVYMLDIAWAHEELESIRKALRETGLTCLPRRAEDDPKIIETWL